MKKICLILSLLAISQSFAQESQPLKWQAAYGFNGSFSKSGSNKSSYQNHQLSFGLYRDINKRWYWNADFEVFGSFSSYNYLGMQTFDSLGNASYSKISSQHSGFGIGATYRVGYKFITRDRFNVSFFLGINASTYVYGRSKSIEPTSTLTTKNLFNTGIGFLGGIQAEYMLKNNSSLFLSYEISNNPYIQIGFRRSFKN